MYDWLRATHVEYVSSPDNLGRCMVSGVNYPRYNSMWSCTLRNIPDVGLHSALHPPPLTHCRRTYVVSQTLQSQALHQTLSKSKCTTVLAQ